MFAVTVPAFLILTFFITPYVMGLLSLADPAGRLAGASSGVIAAGSAVGSAIGGLVVDSAGYVGLAWAVAAFFLLFGCLVAMAIPSSRIASGGLTAT